MKGRLSTLLLKAAILAIFASLIAWPILAFSEQVKQALSKAEKDGCHPSIATKRPDGTHRILRGDDTCTP